MPAGFFLSGERIPASGTYQVRHVGHCLPHEVTLLKDQQFPSCARCGTGVQFKIVRVVRALDERREKIILHVLPALSEQDEQAAHTGHDLHFLGVGEQGGKLHETVCSYCFARLAASPRPEVLRIIERLHTCIVPRGAGTLPA